MKRLLLVGAAAVAGLVPGAGATPRPLLLLQPFDVVEVGGWYVVTDRSADAVYRVNARTKAWRLLTRVRHARELEVVDRSTVLVTSDSDVLRLDVWTGAHRRIAHGAADLLGLARAVNGDLYVSELGEKVVRIAAGGSRATVVDGRNGIHGLTLQGARLLAGESFAGNVLAIDLATSEVETLARGLGNPSYVVPARGGGLYVSEFTGNRVDLLRPDGSLRKVAAVPQVGPLFVAHDGRLLAPTLSGRVVRIDPRTGRVRPLF